MDAANAHVVREELLECSDCGTRYVRLTQTTKEGATVTDKVVPAQKAGAELDTKLSRGELLEKLRRLEETRRDVADAKRTAAKDYGDQLKDIDGEMADVLELLKKAGADKPAS